ncbi:MAG: TonB-dependent receptor plug domain-containing protein, partial [Pseudomonadota bacterium]
MLAGCRPPLRAIVTATWFAAIVFVLFCEPAGAAETTVPATLAQQVAPATEAAITVPATATPTARTEPPDEEEQSFEMVVSGRRAESGRAGTTFEITAQQIADSGARDVGEALVYVPGLRPHTEAYAGAANGKQERLLSVRGFAPDRLLILVDGAPVQEPMFGTVDLARLPIENIERIQVVKGPASLVYGPNSIGGVVNIITGRGRPAPRTFGGAAVGDLGEAHLSLGRGQQAGPVSYFVAGALDRRDGFRLSDDFTPLRNEDGGRRENSDWLAANGFGKVALDLGRHRLAVWGGYTYFDGGVPFSMSDVQPSTLWRKNGGE